MIAKGHGLFNLTPKECGVCLLFGRVSVPMGFSSDGLPIGVQVIGRPNEDELVLAVAEILETARGEFEAPAGL